MAHYSPRWQLRELVFIYKYLRFAVDLRFAKVVQSISAQDVVCQQNDDTSSEPQGTTYMKACEEPENPWSFKGRWNQVVERFTRSVADLFCTPIDMVVVL